MYICRKLRNDLDILFKLLEALQLAFNPDGSYLYAWLFDVH